MTATAPNKILVVDDDQRLRDLLRRYLTEQGFNVFLAESATAMNKLWTRERFDLLVLDLMLPGEDGLAICRKLRGANDTTPIIMLTARGDEVDRIIGLELGADDYLPKPFNPRELVARIHAVLRRRGAPEAPGAPASDLETFEFGPYMLNLQTRTLTHDGQTKSLTTGEFAVMKAFARHPRQPLSREKLMELARGREYEVFDRSLDVQISRLRKLIETDPSSPRYIQTVWGLGYVFIPDGPPPTTRAESAGETAKVAPDTAANDAHPAASHDDHKK
ncbi:MAG: osmolarity response regulator transcription factor OmpR [Burkholderiaceae bacterium]